MAVDAGPRLLLTGFEAFPGVPSNPSALVVERLREQRWAPAGVALDLAILPTGWDQAAPALRKARAATRPDGVLLVGVAASARTFRMETRARNAASTTSPDATGQLHPTAQITEGGPNIRRVTTAPRDVVAAIRAEGLPARCSSNCGDYLCNHTLYRLLDDGGDGPLGFLHIPKVGPRFTLDAIERGVKAAATSVAMAIARTRALQSAII